VSRVRPFLRVGLGALLLWAAATKLPDMAAFAEAVANYRLLPAALAPAAAALVVGLEVVAGALLVVGRVERAAAAVATALLAVFTAALAQALLRGIDLRCGCFGGEERAGGLAVLRDVALLGVALLLAVRRGEHPASHGHGHGHGDEGRAHDHRRDRHGNPEDLERYLARLEDPERIAWQRPDEVVAALGLREGDVACDLGAGPGYFAVRMARAVGPGGRVHAVDVEPRMLEILARRAREAGVSNVHPLLAPAGDGAPPEPCHLILLVNAFHHFADGVATLRRLSASLAPGGRIANVDFHEGELPVGPPPEHKVSRAAFLAAAGEAGLEVADEKTFLPYQYFFLLRRR
jgi:ubiquinone/menaquinone biosynthesis C-methylase UbiE/uncharacterized membrane protein YphA (DoxX/SURF4 family)